MSTYLRFIGVLEFIAAAVGLVVLFLCLGSIDQSIYALLVSGRASTDPNAINGLATFIKIICVVTYLIFAPAIGVMFLVIANINDKANQAAFYSKNTSRMVKNQQN